MPDERESPSAGWREVYREMDAATDAEEATLACPDCGRTCANVLRDVYECEEHGVFRPGADGKDSTAPTDDREAGASGDENADALGDENTDAPDEETVKNRAHGTAD